MDLFYAKGAMPEFIGAVVTFLGGAVLFLCLLSAPWFVSVAFGGFYILVLWATWLFFIRRIYGVIEWNRVLRSAIPG